MKKYLLVIALSIPSFFVFGQSNDKIARLKYIEAKEAYKNQDYVKTEQLLLETKELLGQTNMRIQPMLIKTLSKIPKWQFVKAEIKKYLILNPDTSLIEYAEIMAIGKQVDSALIVENDIYSNIEKKPLIKACNEYLSKYPFGMYRDDVSWLIAKTKNTMVSYYKYTDIYPKGKYFNQAKNITDSTDKAAYEKAIIDGTQDALNYYLSYFSRGIYREYIKQKLNEKIEYDIYVDALNSDLEKYIKKYPNGRYSSIINDKLEEKYYTLGNKYFEDKSYDLAQINYNLYLTKFPSGKYATIIQDKNNKCTRYLKQSGINDVLFTFDTEKNTFGIGYEILDLYNVGYNLQFRCNGDMLTMYEGDDTTDIKLSNKTRKGIASLSLGLNYEIFYPFWLSAGIGVGYYTIFRKEKNYDLWYFDSGNSKIEVFPQLGLSCKLTNKIVLHYGIIYHKNIFHQFGLGFKI